MSSNTSNTGSAVAAARWQVPAYGPPSLLELAEVPSLPDLKQGEVLIKVLATTATYTDLLVINKTYRPTPPLPCTPGYDLIGVVEQAGRDASGRPQTPPRVKQFENSS